MANPIDAQMARQMAALAALGGVAYVLKGYRRRDYSDEPMLVDTHYVKQHPTFAPILLRFGLLDQPREAARLVADVEDLLKLSHNVQQMNVAGGRTMTSCIRAHKKANGISDRANDIVRRAQKSSNAAVVQSCVDLMEDGLEMFLGAIDNVLHNVMIDST